MSSRMSPLPRIWLLYDLQNAHSVANHVVVGRHKCNAMENDGSLAKPDCHSSISTPLLKKHAHVPHGSSAMHVTLVSRCAHPHRPVNLLTISPLQSIMAVPRSSLRGFLAHAKGALRVAIESKQKVTFVIGNESAGKHHLRNARRFTLNPPLDLDSMSCSILYAYIRSMSPPNNAFTSHYIPITNVPASDVQLRPEYLAVFKHANIESSDLITLDDLPSFPGIRSQLAPENTKWILVDHNALQGQLGKVYSSRVAGVIDHHDDEEGVPQHTGNEPRLIQKSGSCTSLVTNFLRPAWDLLSSSAPSSGAAHAPGGSLTYDSASALRWDADVAQLGLASILIDTANLNDVHKTTDDDRKAVEYLEAKIRLCPQRATSFDRMGFYKEINSAKKDIRGLNLRDILRKDYKQWEQNGQKLGVSSVVKSLDFLQKKAGDEAQDGSSDEAFLEAVQSFAEDRGLDTYAIMTTSTSSEGEFQRELLVWAFNDEAVSTAKRFAKSSSEELGLEAWRGSGAVADGSHGNGQWRRVWWQRQVQHSRKRVAPLLREAMA